ncbi:hypothetical protein M8542_36230 [Amycolatopsis sp. OK19-0408]|uniref:RAMA domain-containing protein n=1 Tax=Amycolatopsis iheyensis TaxID=2945988 RepID=A0A9X2NI64_9PSEU|nr:hypothetical protein [Amycolatopsis iheyensis]MCR6488293.1 hypothetical protein [Amycolatopsis iheyensis]
MHATRATAGPTVPPDAVTIVPAAPDRVPLRTPEGVWALVVTTVGLTIAGCGTDPTAPHPGPVHTDITALFAGCWLPGPPPASLNRGDVAVRLTAPADRDRTRADVEVLAAREDGWTSVRTLPALDTRWPHHVATTVLSWMRGLAEEAVRTLTWRAFAASLGSDCAHIGPPPDAADALGTLIDAGLVAVGDHLEWNEHTATVCPGGALVQGTELRELGGSAVSALATSLATPVTVNGWHLWRLARDGRTLAGLRAELAARCPDGPPATSDLP